MRSVDLLVEQLWAPAAADGAVRVVVEPPQDGWTEAEAYWLLPNAERARFLLPRGQGRVTSAAATNYRGLRRPGKNLGRLAIGAASRLGVPPSRTPLSVQVRADRPEAADGLPLRMLEQALDRRELHAAIGVRTGANRKATLQLLDGSGSPVGYAKFGWNDTTDGFVRNETLALKEVGGQVGPMRAPGVLAELDYHGHPVVVTEPLPLDVRGARSSAAAMPTAQELFALCPVHRSDRVAGTEQLRALEGRLHLITEAPLVRDVVGRALELLRTLLEHDDELPVTARWHGDLTPWNRARDGSGQLWVWDWESSESDAVAGLDAMHWAFSVRRPASGRHVAVDLQECLADAGPYLHAAGVPTRSWPVVGAVYALAIVERAADLACRSGSWDPVWIGPQDLTELLDQAGAQLPRQSR